MNHCVQKPPFSLMHKPISVLNAADPVDHPFKWLFIMASLKEIIENGQPLLSLWNGYTLPWIFHLFPSELPK